MWPPEERRNTYAATPRSTHILTLAEVKSHLRVDDTTAGVAASATLGTGNSQLKLTNRLAGTFGNAYTLTIAVAGNNTALSVALANNVYTVTSATNGGGAATSTVNDVIAALAASSTISAKVLPTSGTGTGTGVVGAGSIAFSSGVDGTHPDDDLITGYLYASENTIEKFLRRSLLQTDLVLQMDAFTLCRTLPLDNGPVQSITSFQYYDSNNALQTVDGSTYALDNKSVPDVIELNSTASWPATYQRRNAVLLAYRAGWANADAIPAEIKIAAKLYCGHLYENRENTIISASGNTAVGGAIKEGAEMLLWPYRDYRFV
jgi:uncharacterized phiE125 gp8 family phage protein